MAELIEAFHRRVTCRIFGHRFTVLKMHAVLCSRCRTARPR